MNLVLDESSRSGADINFSVAEFNRYPGEHLLLARVPRGNASCEKMNLDDASRYLEASLKLRKYRAPCG
jgi:hypothetical protein